MGRNMTPGRQYQLKALTDRHKEICRRLFLGEKIKDIAADLGVTREMVSIVRGSQVAKDHIRRLERLRDADSVDVAQQLKSLAPEAVKALDDALAGKMGGNAQDHARMRAAEQVLDRSGHGKETRIQNDSGGIMGAIVRQKLIDRAIEVGILAPETPVIEIVGEEGCEEL